MRRQGEQVVTMLSDLLQYLPVRFSAPEVQFHLDPIALQCSTVSIQDDHGLFPEGAFLVQCVGMDNVQQVHARAQGCGQG